MKLISKNRRAPFDYHLSESFEAGIVLSGFEVKSVKLGRINITESYVRVKDEEAFLLNAHIAPYSRGNKPGYDPRATRKLLLKRREIEYLAGKLNTGLVIVPLIVYLKRGLIKVEICLARPKKKYDKREKLKKEAQKRETERILKERRG